MSALGWWVFGVGLYGLGVLSGLGLCRGVAHADRVEAQQRFRYGYQPRADGRPVTPPPAGPGASSSAR